MSGNRFRLINQWYYDKFEEVNASNDAADSIIRSPDRHLVSQQQLFELNGGWSTIGLSLGAATFGHLLIFAFAPRTAVHFRRG